MAMRLLVLVLTFFLAINPAFAGETAWQEIAPGVNLRLISTGIIRSDGTTLAALELDMPRDTKTYWRVPGQTGLPTELDSRGSEGIETIAIRWPYPVRDVQQDYLDYVYFGHVVLPIAVKVRGDRPKLHLTTLLGVCSDICIPAQASFMLPLRDAKPDRPNGLRIRQALADVPITWPDEALPLADLRWSADGMGLLVRVNGSEVDPASLIASTTSGEPLFGAPQKSPQDNLVLLPILGKTDNSALDDMEVQLTFMTQRGPFELTGAVGAAPREDE